jgi:hypothetical protein
VRRTLQTLALVVLAAGCERGDWLGPFERAVREVTFAWDMWDTDAVRPYERPMPPVPEGTVAVTGTTGGYEEGLVMWRSLTPAQHEELSSESYRRYCHHCHGASGDGRSIVGESFHPKVPDLRADEIQDLANEQIYTRVSEGTQIMIPLGDTMTPLELMLAIEHVRSLQGAPSRPYFSPKNIEPLE